MALSISEPTAEATDNSDGTSYAPLTAYTPAANSLQIVFVFAAGTVAAGSMTGGSLTWHQLGRRASGAGSTLYVFAAQAGASPASCDPTFDCTGDGATGVTMAALEVTGHNQNCPFRQIGGAAANAADPSVPFGTALLTSNAYVMGIGVNRTAPAYTPFSGSTETCDTGHTTPNSGMELAYKINGNTGTSLAATGTTGNYAAIALEINEASNAAATFGINFRATSGYVSDAAGDTYSLGEAGFLFRGGMFFGWTDGLGGDRARDRDNTVNARQAGGNFSNSSGSQDRVTILERYLPWPGTWRIRVSAGDRFNARSNQKIEIFDDTTSKGTIVNDASTASDHYVDATNVERTSVSDWGTNNASTDIVFSTNKFVMKTGTTNADSSNTFLTHVSFEYVPPANAYTLTADAGSYALTGTAASLEAGRSISAAAGSYALTGTTATLAKGRTLTADPGSYALTGTAATLEVGRSVSAASGSYSLTGTAASLEIGRAVSAAAGSYVLSGTAVSLERGYVLSAAGGSYALTGTDATLTYTPAGDVTMSADPGSYALTGTAATLRRGLRLTADAGSYALSGTAASLLDNKKLTGDPGGYTLTGTAASFLIGRTVQATSGSYVFTGTAATFPRGRILTLDPGAFTLTGVAATLEHGGQIPEAARIGRSKRRAFEGFAKGRSYGGRTAIRDFEG